MLKGYRDLQRLALAGAMAAGIAGCSSTVALPPGVKASIGPDEPTMTTAELTSTFEGRNTAGVVAAGKYAGVQWESQATSPGTVAVHDNEPFSDTGMISRRDNTECTKFTKIRGGMETCERVVKYGDNQYASYTPLGQIDSLYHVVP